MVMNLFFNIENYQTLFRSYHTKHIVVVVLKDSGTCFSFSRQKKGKGWKEGLGFGENDFEDNA